ncbi:hypothetical protein E2C01_098708 [Portunus trituberculatus]|uniref:Uncharacterized protein n=1 Tax=Portunus trituberculatus TaxID=210409 RepID=A0A5B7KDK0_PORTR|nr:hypothetical protein [Portunus trituberculatus]
MRKVENVNDCKTARGHGLKLKKGFRKRDVKKYSFPHRVVNNWNELDEEVVMAGIVHNFKKKFDKRYRDRTP